MIGIRRFVGSLVLVGAAVASARAGSLDASLESTLRSGEDVRVIVTFKSTVAKGKAVTAAQRGSAI